MDRAMIREAKGTELENDDGATAAVVNLPAWSAGHKRQSSASNWYRSERWARQLILYRSEREHLLIPHNPFITRARGPHGLVRAINTIFILLDGKTNVARAPHQRPQLLHSFIDNTFISAPFLFRTLWFRRIFCFHCTYSKVCLRYWHSRLFINLQILQISGALEKTLVLPYIIYPFTIYFSQTILF